ncbi:Signal transduction histidine-protein kinase/phosphatase DegS [compost metagenome]
MIETQHGMQDDEWLKSLAGLKKIADSTVESVQRIAADLRPLILDELGLLPAIDWLLESFSERSAIAYELSLPATPLDYSREASTAIFRILQESLTNVSRHSQATLVGVALKETKDFITLKITDNGKGIDSSVSRQNSLGLLGMRERAFMLGGKLKIQSRAGSGTSIEVRIPKTNAAHAGDRK